MAAEKLDVEVLRKYLSYDPVSGVLTWRISPSASTKAGVTAGSIQTQTRRGKTTHYLTIALHWQRFSAAAAAWAIFYGVWPVGRLYPVDGDALNLRINNLRTAEVVVKGTYDQKTKEGKKAYQEARRALKPEVGRSVQLRNNYGLSMAAYAAMHAEQGGLCEICRQRETMEHCGKLRQLSVDHNHKTGAVRGLLCSNCNTLLGRVDESRELLQAAISYLDKYEGAACTSIRAMEQTAPVTAPPDAGFQPNAPLTPNASSAAPAMQFSAALLRDFLTYAPETGELVWKESRGTRAVAGSAAGITKTVGRNADGSPRRVMYIGIAGRKFVASNVAWALYYGDWPSHSISFRDGDPLNLRLGNLYNKRAPLLESIPPFAPFSPETA
jgi:hypothetical protein